MSSEDQQGIRLNFLSSLEPSCGSLMGSFPQAVVGVKKLNCGGGSCSCSGLLQPP